MATLVLLTCFASGAAASHLAELDFMTGRWRYVAEDSVAEEWWMEASGNTKVAAFRWVRDGKVLAIELVIISEETEGTFLRFKHFGPDFIPWERDEPNVYRLSSVVRDRAEFRRVSGGTSVPLAFIYQRHGRVLTFRGTNDPSVEEAEGDLVLMFQSMD
jgi:hypothetical protein